MQDSRLVLTPKMQNHVYLMKNNKGILRKLYDLFEKNKNKSELLSRSSLLNLIHQNFQTYSDDFKTYISTEPGKNPDFWNWRATLQTFLAVLKDQTATAKQEKLFNNFFIEDDEPSQATESAPPKSQPKPQNSSLFPAQNGNKAESEPQEDGLTSKRSILYGDKTISRVISGPLENEFGRVSDDVKENDAKIDPISQTRRLSKGIGGQSVRSITTSQKALQVLKTPNGSANIENKSFLEIYKVHWHNE